MNFKQKVFYAKWSTIIVLLVIVGCSYYLNQFVADKDSLFKQSFPTPLKTVLANPELTKVDSVAIAEDAFHYLKRDDDMLRALYKVNVQSSQGANQLRLFLEFPDWDSHQWIGYVSSLLFVLFVVFLFCRIQKKENLLGKNLLNCLGVTIPLIALLTFLNLSLQLSKDEVNHVDFFFVIVCFFCVAIFVISFNGMYRSLRDDKFFSPIRLIRLEHRQRTLIRAAITGLTAAYLVYFIGMYTGGTQKSIVTALFRPALSACKMFFMADSTSELSSVLRQSGGFMGFYSLVKLFVLCVSSSTLLFLIFNRWQTILKTRLRNAEGKELYVFFGITRASKILARDILCQNKDNIIGEDRIVLFVDSKKEDSNLFKSVSFSGLLGLFRHRGEAYNEVEDLNALLVISNVMLSSPNCDDLIERMEHEKISKDNIIRSLGLKHFFRLAEQAKNVHCFFLYDDEQININGANNLRSLINKVYEKKTTINPKLPKIIKIHCWARKDGRTQMLEIPEGNDCTEIKVLDSSLLSVQSLMQQPECHPVQFVDVDTKTASVISRFEALIIGFGETGQDTLRFLYEFGAFLHHDCAKYTDSTKALTYRSPFHCDVIDGQMATLKPTFISQTPAIKDAYNMKKICSNNWIQDRKDPLVSFYQAKVGDEDFISLVEKVIETVNYVVVALGNDELNIKTLNLLMPMIVKIRNGRMDRLKVLVRNYRNDYNDVLSNIVNYYNELFSSQKPIILFGQESSLFSYKLVVGEELIKNAEIFYEHYRDLKKDSSDKPWAVRHQEAKGFKYDDKKDEYKPIPLSWSIRPSIKRKEQQDINNYLHIDTKLRLIIDSKTKHDKRIYQELSDGLVFNNSGRKYVIENKKYSNIYTNLARTEKLRWNASHEMLGYLPNEGTGCNELDKTHNCLINWCNLPEATERYNREAQKKGWSLVDYQAYDYLVVKTTFELTVKN